LFTFICFFHYKATKNLNKHPLDWSRIFLLVIAGAHMGAKNAQKTMHLEV
jgi:hypothetical protein